MVIELSDSAEFRQRLLSHPGERQEVDYKESHAFAPDDEFSLKLVKHIHGMANGGGGWLVIGFSETQIGLVSAALASNVVDNGQRRGQSREGPHQPIRSRAVHAPHEPGYSHAHKIPRLRLRRAACESAAAARC